MEIIELKNTIIKIKTQWMDLLVEATEDKSIKFNQYEQERQFQKNIYFCFIDYAKAFDCMDQKKLRKILQVMRILDYLTCLLRNLYTGQETTVRIGHETTDWSQIAQSCPTLCDPMDCSLPGFSIHGILQARILE